jgi:hypothetical protein
MKSLEFEKVSVDDARKALDGSPKQDKAPDASAQRSQVQANPRLLEATNVWMASLPWEVRPAELARQFPRIANSIAELWRRVARCEEYLDGLVVDQRGGRQGFPPSVAQELTKLRAYYAELHPQKGSSWDLVERDK